MHKLFHSSSHHQLLLFGKWQECNGRNWREMCSFNKSSSVCERRLRSCLSVHTWQKARPEHRSKLKGTWMLYLLGDYNFQGEHWPHCLQMSPWRQLDLSRLCSSLNFNAPQRVFPFIKFLFIPPEPKWQAYVTGYNSKSYAVQLPQTDG